MGADDLETGDVGLQSHTISWENLGYKVSVKGKDKIILNGLTGFVKPGSMLAILGASGAGKSTFLDLLADRKTKHKYKS